jgi:hypothetical protein
MGGPWKSRGFDAVAWRPPAAHAEGHPEQSASQGGHDYLVGIVIGYLASVVTSVVVMLTLLKHGW